MRETVNIRLAPAGVAVIDVMAAAEHRTRSDMIRVLLIEAVAARQTAVIKLGPRPEQDVVEDRDRGR